MSAKGFRIAVLSLTVIASFSHAFVLQSNVLFTRRSFLPYPVRAAARGSSTLEMSYKKVFVAGGSRGVGRCIIDQLTSSGAEVVALVRSDEAAEELNAIKGVKAIKGDAFVYKDVENSMDGCDAAITTLGGMTEDRRVDYEVRNTPGSAVTYHGTNRRRPIGWALESRKHAERTVLKPLMFFCRKIVCSISNKKLNK